MSTIGTQSGEHKAPVVARPNGSLHAPPEKPRKSIARMVVLVLLFGGAPGVPIMPTRSGSRELNGTSTAC